MTTFKLDPVITVAGPADGFYQTVRLADGVLQLGVARWHAGGDGVIQLLDLAVNPDHRRRGVGSSILREVVQQAAAFHELRKSKFRRVWMSVEQKSQVNGRAFLTKHGFHHTATINELLHKQDALIYVKAMD